MLTSAKTVLTISNSPPTLKVDEVGGRRPSVLDLSTYGNLMFYTLDFFKIVLAVINGVIRLHLHYSTYL